MLDTITYGQDCMSVLSKSSIVLFIMIVGEMSHFCSRMNCTHSLGWVSHTTPSSTQPLALRSAMYIILMLPQLVLLTYSVPDTAPRNIELIGS